MTMIAVDVPALGQVPRPPSRLRIQDTIERIVDALYSAITTGDEETLADLRTRGQAQIDEARERGELPCVDVSRS